MEHIEERSISSPVHSNNQNHYDQQQLGKNTSISNFAEINKKPQIRKSPIDGKGFFCTCTKSSCQKNYCDCYKNGYLCGDQCRCMDCKNTRADEIKIKPDKFAIEFTRVSINQSLLKVKQGKSLICFETKKMMCSSVINDSSNSNLTQTNNKEIKDDEKISNFVTENNLLNKQRKSDSIETMEKVQKYFSTSKSSLSKSSTNISNLDVNNSNSTDLELNEKETIEEKLPLIKKLFHV